MKVKYKLCFLLLSMILAQGSWAQVKAGGVIRDADSKEPLIGATIMEKGTTNGTITDIDGKFDLTVSSDQAVLVVSYIGYATMELGAGSNLSINLSLDIDELDEVVVVGYGTQRKSDLTGSVVGIKTDDLMQSRTNNLFNAMQGRLAGVQITTDSGQPGAGLDIIIRGQTSINGSSSPLFVIDGVQIDVNYDEVATTASTQSRFNPLTAINPADIESIEVLKDASATAIFGSRGTNGVVIVTTKSGKKGRSTVDYTFNLSSSSAIKKMDVLTAEQYLDYQAQRNNDVFLYENGDVNLPRNFDEMRSYDWQEEALRTAITQQHQLSLSGQGGTTNYSAGVGYLKQEGLIINNDFEQYSMRLRLNNEVNEKFSLGFNVNGSYSVLSGVANSGGPNNFTGITQALLTSNPWDIITDDLDLTSTDYISPIALINETDKATSALRVISSLNLNYKITKDLKYTALMAGNISHSKVREYFNSTTAWGQLSGGRAGIKEVGSYSYNHSSQLHYDKELNSDNRLSAMAGFEIYHYNYESFENQVGVFEDESTGVYDISKGLSVNAYNSSRIANSRLSYFARVNYTLFDRYLLTATVRADGTDKFGADNRWGYFPSAAIGWRVSDEAFMQGVETISNLKLRLSYGVTGNERIPPYSQLASIVPYYYGSNDQVIFGMAPETLENPELRWETTTQYNAGFDLGLFEGRLNITADYYNKATTDLLLNAPVPSQTGYNNRWLNIGQINNYGFEFQVSTFNIDKNDFKWSTDFNITFNRNKVIDLGGAEFIPLNLQGGWQTEPGRVMLDQPIGTMYGYKVIGVWQIDDFTWDNNSDPTIPHADRTYVPKSELPVNQSVATPQPGHLKYADVDGDGFVTAEDRTILGNGLPKHIGGLSNNFTYKNFDLSIFLQWSYGNDIYNSTLVRLHASRGPSMNISQDYYLNHWTPENPSNKYPDYGQVHSSLPSSYFVEDGSYLRLKTVSFGYTVPKNITNKIGFKSLKVSVIGNNLLTWTKYTGWDPEVNFNNPLMAGYDRIAYPRSRTYTFSLNAKF